MEEDYADVYYVDTRNAMYPSVTSRMPWMPNRPRPTSTQTVYVPPRHVRPHVGHGQLIQQGPPQSTAAAFLGKLTTGQIVEMVAQVFAALQSLPGAPVATKDVGTDVANLILYQNALAQHAKRDEQVRTLGGLVARLVG